MAMPSLVNSTVHVTRIWKGPAACTVVVVLLLLATLRPQVRATSQGVV